MATLLDEFVRITNTLNDRGIDYAVCGGWAMAIHGFLRATTDIDLVILSSDLDAVETIALENGFDIKGLTLEFDGGETQIHRVSKVDPATHELITLDMILVTDLYRDVWSRRQAVSWNQGQYFVVDREGMILMKERARRPKDLIDLQYLRGEE